jgi:hypothetical protein
MVVGIYDPLAQRSTAISLLDFEGHLKQNTILLEWSTSSEANSNYFELKNLSIKPIFTDSVK